MAVRAVQPTTEFAALPPFSCTQSVLHRSQLLPASVSSMNTNPIPPSQAQGGLFRTFPTPTAVWFRRPQPNAELRLGRETSAFPGGVSSLRRSPQPPGPMHSSAWNGRMMEYSGGTATNTPFGLLSPSARWLFPSSRPFPIFLSFSRRVSSVRSLPLDVGRGSAAETRLSEKRRLFD